MSTPSSWPDTLDAVLHLLDRQIVDRDGLMVGKVDDVEVVDAGTDQPDLRITGLLVGEAALTPRLGGRSGRVLEAAWRRMGDVRADRDIPGRIDLGLVAQIGSHVTLSVAGRGVIVPGQLGGRPQPRRLGDLLECAVVEPGEGSRGGVLDVRCETDRDHPDRGIRVTSLIVGRGRPGSLLGYDRHPDQGPWLLNRTVRWLHRHTHLVGLSVVAGIDWESRVIRVDSEGGEQGSMSL